MVGGWGEEERNLCFFWVFGLSGRKSVVVRGEREVLGVLVVMGDFGYFVLDTSGGYFY